MQCVARCTIIILHLALRMKSEKCIAAPFSSCFCSSAFVDFVKLVPLLDPVVSAPLSGWVGTIVGCLNGESPKLYLCQIGEKVPRRYQSYSDEMKTRRHPSPCPQLWPGPPAVLLSLCMSNVPLLRPGGVSPHIFAGGVEGTCNTFSFPLLAMKCQPSQNSEQQTYRVTDASHAGTSFHCHLAWTSWLPPPPVLYCGHAKYVSECRANNMWQETSDWCSCVDLELENLPRLDLVECSCFRCSWSTELKEFHI